MTHVDDARKLRWYCELCERMHPIGEHDPGKSWPPAAVQPPRARRPASGSVNIYRCHCGLHLFATAETARPEAWARHLAHIEAFQDEIPRMPGNPTGGGH